MAEYPYIANAAKIRKFLETIQAVGVPPKLSIKYVASLGFKSANDRPLVAIMKAIGFASQSGEPTERWKQYRNKKQAGAVLAEGIRECYAELFKTYPDAHLKDNEALHNFFSTHTAVGAVALKFMVMTFKALANLADFGVTPSTPREVPVAHREAVTPRVSVSPTGKSGVGITINIQLTLPEGSTAETFDAFFKAMRKHLPLD